MINRFARADGAEQAHPIMSALSDHGRKLTSSPKYLIVTLAMYLRYMPFRAIGHEPKAIEKVVKVHQAKAGYRKGC